MAYINVTLPEGESVCTGKQVTFRAPCNCDVPEGIQIGNVQYTLKDAACTSLVGSRAFAAGAMVSVILDVDNNSAYLINGKGSAAVALLPPTDLAAVPGDTEVSLTWTNPSDIVIGSTTVAHLDHIEIKRDGVVVASSVSGTSYTDEGLNNDTTYVYKVVAVTSDGERSESTSVSVTTAAAFSATISVTNASANATVTFANGTDTYTTSANADGEASYTVHADGEYTVSANGVGTNKRYSKTVTISEDGESVSVRLGSVPSEYAQVEYIKSSGTQWINVGINATYGYEVYADYEYLNTTSYHIVSANVDNVPSRLTGLYEYVGSYAKHRMCADGVWKTSSSSISTNTRYKVTSRITENNCFMAVNGTTIINEAYTKKDANTTPMTLLYFVSDAGNDNHAKLYSVTIKQIDGEYVRNFIPCYRISDGVIGLYDTVTDELFTNSGSGTFLRGNRVDLPTVSINLTVEGANQDNITITDASGTTVGLAVISSGCSTTVQLEIVDGEDYTFTSSVAKATDGSGTDYSKTITLTNSSTSVKVMPDSALYWYGNECTDLTGGWTVDGYSWVNSGVALVAPTKETNDIRIPLSGTSLRLLGTSNAINFNDYSKFKVVSQCPKANSACVEWYVSKTSFSPQNAYYLPNSSTETSGEFNATPKGNMYMIVVDGSNASGYAYVYAIVGE